MKLLWVLLLIIHITGCTKDEIQTQPIIEPIPLKPEVAVIPTMPAECKKLPGQLPYFIPKSNLVLTQITKTCGPGTYREDSGLVLMGLPCTGGPGDIEVKGAYWAPKAIGFVFATHCSMNPVSIDQAMKIVSQELELGPKAKILAYNPLAVQYYEFPELPDSGIGFKATLRSRVGKTEPWRQFRKQPIPIQLVGRENAWGADPNLFLIKGGIKFIQNRKFKLMVESFELLDADQLTQVRSRCENHRPTMNCSFLDL